MFDLSPRGASNPVKVHLPIGCSDLRVGSLRRAWAWGLQFFPTNEECLVVAGHGARRDSVPALCTHRPSLLPIGCTSESLGLAPGVVP